MLKEEIIIREISCKSLFESGIFKQNQISKSLHVSIGLVNRIMRKLEMIGGLQENKRYFKVIDLNKILIYASSIRNIQRDIIYETRVNLPVKEIENSLPDGTILGSYSAYKYFFNDAPSDYSEVWVYSNPDVLNEIKSRFLKNNLPPNLIVLKSDSELVGNVSKYSNGNNVISLPQLYTDFWNIPTWYSKEYLIALERKIMEIQNGILE